jgi:hypothetical protein
MVEHVWMELEITLVCVLMVSSEDIVTLTSKKETLIAVHMYVVYCTLANHMMNYFLGTNANPTLVSMESALIMSIHIHAPATLVSRARTAISMMKTVLNPVVLMVVPASME